MNTPVLANEVSALDDTKAYVRKVYEAVITRDPHEYEFHQAVKEMLDSLVPVIARHEKYRKNGILERIVEPDLRKHPVDRLRRGQRRDSA